MVNLWRRISYVVKDKNSIYLAKLAKRSSYRNPELETSVIKATSHDENTIDRKNSKRIFSWIKSSPSFLKPVLWSLSTRMEKTRCWVVALKGLMLMHGIFCCNIPFVQKMGRLPFDLSNFNDARGLNSTWGYSAFVRAYFCFLDRKASFEAQEVESEGKDLVRMVPLLESLNGLQVLLDIILEIRPYGDMRFAILISEAMDCITIEVFEVYSKLCNGVAEILGKIYNTNKAEATMALSVLQKAATQGNQLEEYFEFCSDIGVLNVSEIPTVEHIPEEDIRDIELFVERLGGEKDKKRMISYGANKKVEITIPSGPSKAIVEIQETDQADLLKTVISDKWVHFDDDFKVNDEAKNVYPVKGIDHSTNPFVTPTLLCYDTELMNSHSFPQLEQCSYDRLRGNLSKNGNQSNLILSM